VRHLDEVTYRGPGLTAAHAHRGSQDARATSRGLDHPQKQANSRRLARAIEAQERIELALGHAQGEVGDRGDIPVALREVFGFNRQVHCRYPSTGRETIR